MPQHSSILSTAHLHNPRLQREYSKAWNRSDSLRFVHFLWPIEEQRNAPDIVQDPTTHCLKGTEMRRFIFSGGYGCRSAPWRFLKYAWLTQVSLRENEPRLVVKIVKCKSDPPMHFLIPLPLLVFSVSRLSDTGTPMIEDNIRVVGKKSIA